MEISIKWNVCRVCLQEVDNNLSRCLFKDGKLAKQILECSGIKMKLGDCMPEKICRKCLMVLKYAVNFRKLCRRSDEYLQTVIQKTKSASSLFTLDRRREETLQLMTDVIDNLFDDDGDEGDECDRGDNGKEKRRRTTLDANTSAAPTDGPMSKKVRVDTQDRGEQTCPIMEDAATQNVIMKSEIMVKEPPDIPKSSCAQPMVNADKLNLEQRLEHRWTEENDEEHDDTEFIDEHDDNDTGGEESDYKTALRKPATSVCSIEDDYYMDDEEEQLEGVHIDASDSAVNEEKPFILVAAELDNDQHETETDEYDEDNDKADINAPPQTVTNDDYYLLNEPENTESDAKEAPTLQFTEIEPADEASGGAFAVHDDGEDESSQQELYYSLPELEVAEVKTVSKSKSISVLSKRLKTPSGGSFVCEICGNSFTHRSLLTYHMRMHRNERRYECELCFKRFTTACNLSAHIRVHTGEKRYECKYCGRRFTDRSTHIKHERIHTNERPFTCDICGKSFSMSTTLRRHEKTHNDERPYKCVPCGKSFKLPHQFKSHLNTMQHKTCVEHEPA